MTAVTHVINRCHQIILIRRHTKLRHDVLMSPFIHDASIGHIVGIDILEQKHDGAQRHEMPVDLAQQLLLLVGRQKRPRTHSFGIVAFNASICPRISISEGPSPSIVQAIVGMQNWLCRYRRGHSFLSRHTGFNVVDALLLLKMRDNVNSNN